MFDDLLFKLNFDRPLKYHLVYIMYGPTKIFKHGDYCVQPLFLVVAYLKRNKRLYGKKKNY